MGIKISALPAVSAALTTDTFPVVQAGITRKETILQARTLFGFDSSTGLLGVSKGGTNANLTLSNGSIVYSTATELALVATQNNSVLVTNNTGIPVQSGTLTNGQMIIGSTGAPPAVGSISVSGNLSRTLGAGTFALSTIGFASFTYNNVITATQTLSGNNGYVSNNSGSNVTYTLPASCSVGSIIEIVGSCSGGWNIVQLANQIIHVGSSATTTGVGGSITSSNRYDGIRMICIVANLEFTVLGHEGTLTVV